MSDKKTMSDKKKLDAFDAWVAADEAAEKELEAREHKQLDTAATAGDPYAMWTLARRYEEGNGTAENLSLAKQWCQKAAESGLKAAQLYIQAHEEDASAPKDKFLELLRNTAKQHKEGKLDDKKEYCEICMALGEAYDGDVRECPIHEDEHKAEKWYKKAMELGEGVVDDARYKEIKRKYNRTHELLAEWQQLDEQSKKFHEEEKAHAKRMRIVYIVLVLLVVIYLCSKFF